MLNWLDKNKSGIGVILAGIPLLWGVFTYLMELNQNKRAANFKLYHEVIKQINIAPKISSQRALIYELSNFPEYAEFTCREVDRLSKWFQDETMIIEFEFVKRKLKCKRGQARIKSGPN